MTKNRSHPHSLWLRCTSLGMAVVFFYVQVAYGVIEPALKSRKQGTHSTLWEERKAAAERLKESETEQEEDQDQEKETLLAKVAAPKLDNGILSQIPSLNLNLLPNSIPKTVVNSTKINLQSDVKSRFEVLPSWFKALSISYASLTDLYLPPNWKPGDFMVVHIQDAHENYEAQKNIAKIIESLEKSSQAQALDSKNFSSESNSRLIVGLEGASGSFNFSLYRLFPKKQIVKEVADYLLKESLISGPEYVGMTINRLPLFWGIEDKDLYLQHIQAFKDSAPLEKRAKQSVKELETKIEQLKETVFNQELKNFDRAVTQYTREGIKLSAYLKILTKKGIPSPSLMIQRYMNALYLEESMDYDRVEKERRALTNELVEKLSKQEMNDLVSASLSYRVGNISYGSFYQYLKDLCQAYQVKLREYPEMDKYIRYVLISDQIKSEELFIEISSLEQKRIELLIQNSKEKELIQTARGLELLNKLVHFQLSPEEWEEYQKSKKKIEELISGRIKVELKSVQSPLKNQSSSSSNFLDSKSLEPFEQFNQAGIFRNQSLINNLLKKSGIKESVLEPSSQNRIAVLVAGGFHTSGITQILKNKQLAYCVLTPKLKVVEGTGTEYLEIFRRDKTPLEKLFTGERITLKSPLGTGTPISLGNEWAPIFTVLERMGESLLLAELIKELGSQVTDIAETVEDEILREKSKWVEAVKSQDGFKTTRDLSFEVIFEERNKDGEIQKLVVSVTMFGSKGHEDSLITYEILRKDSKVIPGIGKNSSPVYKTIQLDAYTFNIYRGKEKFLPKAANILARFGGIFATKIYSVIGASTLESGLFLSLPQYLISHLLHISLFSHLGILIFLLVAIPVFAAFHYEGKLKDIGLRLIPATLFAVAYLAGAAIGGDMVAWLAASIVHGAFNLAYLNGWFPEWFAKLVGLATIGAKVTDTKWQTYQNPSLWKTAQEFRSYFTKALISDRKIAGPELWKLRRELEELGGRSKIQEFFLQNLAEMSSLPKETQEAIAEGIIGLMDPGSKSYNDEIIERLIKLQLSSSQWAEFLNSVAEKSSAAHAFVSPLVETILEHERKKQEMIEREKRIERAWKEMVVEGVLYHGTSINNLESIRQVGLDPDYKPFDKDEVKQFFAFHQRYFGLSSPFKNSRHQDAISLTYNKTLANDFAGKPPEVIDIILRESQRIIDEYESGEGKNKLTENDYKWLLKLNEKYRKWSERHRPLVLAVPIQVAIRNALNYQLARRELGSLLDYFDISPEQKDRVSPLFAFYDKKVFKLMVDKLSRGQDLEVYLKTELPEELKSILRDVEFSQGISSKDILVERDGSLVSIQEYYTQFGTQLARSAPEQTPVAATLERTYKIVEWLSKKFGIQIPKWVTRIFLAGILEIDRTILAIFSREKEKQFIEEHAPKTEEERRWLESTVEFIKKATWIGAGVGLLIAGYIVGLGMPDSILRAIASFMLSIIVFHISAHSIRNFQKEIGLLKNIKSTIRILQPKNILFQLIFTPKEFSVVFGARLANVYGMVWLSFLGVWGSLLKFLLMPILSILSPKLTENQKALYAMKIRWILASSSLGLFTGLGIVTFALSIGLSLPDILVKEMVFNPAYLGAVVGILIGLGAYLNVDRKALEITIENNYRLYKLMAQRKLDPYKVSDDEINLLSNTFYISKIAEDGLAKLHSLLLEDLQSSHGRTLIENIYGDFILNDRSRILFNSLWNELENQLKKEETNQEVLITMIRLLTAHWDMYADEKKLDRLREIMIQIYRRFGTQNFVEEIMNPLLKKMNMINAHQKTLEPSQEWNLNKIKARKEEIMKQIETQINILSSTVYEALSSKELEKNKDGWNILNNLIELIKNEDWDINAAAENISNLTPFIEMGAEPVISYLVSKLEPELTENERQILIKIMVGNPTNEEIISILMNKEVKIKERTAYLILLRHHKDSNRKALLEDIISEKGLSREVRIYAFTWYSSQYFHAENEDKFEEMLKLLADEAKNLISDAIFSNDDAKIEQLFNDIYLQDEEAKVLVMATLLVLQKEAGSFSFAENFLKTAKRISNAKVRAYWGNATSGFTLGGGLLDGRERKTALFFQIIAHELGHRILWDQHNYSTNSLKAGIIHEFISDIHTFLFTNVFKDWGLEAQSFMKAFNYDYHYNTVAAGIYYSNEVHEGGRAQLAAIQKKVADIDWKVFLSVCFEVLKSEKNRGKELEEIVELSLNEYFKKGIKVTPVEASKKSAGFTRYAIRPGGIRIFSSDKVADLFQKFSTIPASILGPKFALIAGFLEAHILVPGLTLFSKPIMKLLLLPVVRDQGIANKLVEQNLNSTKLTRFFSRWGSVIFFAGLAGSGISGISLIMVPVTVLWMISAGFVFAGSHKGRSKKEQFVLGIVGALLAGVTLIPALLFYIGIPIPSVPLIGEISNLGEALGIGLGLNVLLHTLYNAVVLGARARVNKIIAQGKEPSRLLHWISQFTLAAITGPLAAEPKIKSITGFLNLGDRGQDNKIKPAKISSFKSDQDQAKEDAKQLVHLIFSGQLADYPLDEVILKINQIPGIEFRMEDISLSNITLTPLGDDKNINKWVFKVSLTPSVHLVLGMTKKDSVTGITEQEIEDFERLSESSLTPRLIGFGQYRSQYVVRDYLLLEFIEGPTAAELIDQGQFSPEKRRAVVDTILEISKVSPNQDFLYDEVLDETMLMIPLMMPMDINEDNFILKRQGSKENQKDHGTPTVRQSRFQQFGKASLDKKDSLREDLKKKKVKAVMIDLGGPKIALGTSLATIIQYYGYFDKDSGTNDFIFQSFLEIFGMNNGLNLLKENLAYMKRTKMLRETILRSGFNPSNIKEIKEELILLNMAIKDLNQFLQTLSLSKPDDFATRLRHSTSLGTGSGQAQDGQDSPKEAKASLAQELANMALEGELERTELIVMSLLNRLEKEKVGSPTYEGIVGALRIILSKKSDLKYTLPRDTLERILMIEETANSTANILARFGGIFATKLYSTLGASTLESGVFLYLPHYLISHLLHLSLFSHAGLLIFILAAIPIFAAFHYEGKLKDIGLRFIPATLFAVAYLAGAAIGGDIVAWMSASIVHGAFNLAYLNGWFPDWFAKYVGLAAIGAGGTGGTGTLTPTPTPTPKIKSITGFLNSQTNGQESKQIEMPLDINNKPKSGKIFSFRKAQLQKQERESKLREGRKPSDIKSLLLSLAVAVQTFNPVDTFNRFTANIRSFSQAVLPGLSLSRAKSKEEIADHILRQERFNQKILDSETQLAKEEMKKIASFIMQDTESLNRTSPLGLRFELRKLMDQRMNQSLDKMEFRDLKVARTSSMGEALTLLMEDYEQLISLETVADNLSKQKRSAVLIMTMFHFLILQDEADLKLPFVPHSIKHTLNVRKEVGNIIDGSPTIQANLKEYYGEAGVSLALFSAWLHDIGYGILIPAMKQADLTAKELEKQGHTIAEGYESGKGYHTDLGGTLARIPLDGKEREKGTNTLAQQLESILGLKWLKGNAEGSKNALEDLLLVIKDHGSDKEEVTEDGLRGTGKHKLRPASNQTDILNFLVRMADNLDSVAYHRLYDYQNNPFFIDYLRQMETAFIQDGRKVGALLEAMREKLLKDMQTAKLVYAHYLEVSKGLTREEALNKSKNEFGLMELYVKEHNGKDYPHFAGMLYSQRVEEDQDGNLVVLAELNDFNRNIPQELHAFQLNRMKVAYESLRFNGRRILIKDVNASEVAEQKRDKSLDTREDSDTNRKRREQIDRLQQVVELTKQVVQLERQYQSDDLAQGFNPHQIPILEALIHYLKTHPGTVLDEVSKSDGEQIVSMNDSSEEVYIVLDGIAEVFKGGFNQDRIPNTLTPGSILGDSAHERHLKRRRTGSDLIREDISARLSNYNRTEDVYAGSDKTMLYRLSAQQFQALFSDPQFLVAYAGLIHSRSPPTKSNIVPFKRTKEKIQERIQERAQERAKADILPLREEPEPTILDLLPQPVRHLISRFTQSLKPKHVGDPLTSLEQGKKRRIKKLKKLKEDELYKFRFAIGDIDNISKMNDFFGKDLIGGLTKSSSDNVIFDNQDVPLFVKIREAKNKALRNKVHAYVGGDEFIPEWDDWSIRWGIENEFLIKLQNWINNFITWIRKYILLQSMDLEDGVKNFRKELEGRYVVFKIKTEELTDEQKEALKALKGSEMMIRHEDGYNLLIDRGKKGVVLPLLRVVQGSIFKGLSKRWIKSFNDSMSKEILGILPELETVKDGVTHYEVTPTISIGAVDAGQLERYILSKLKEERWNLGKKAGQLTPQWIDPKTGRIRAKRAEEFYLWGMRIANDMLKIAKDSGKDQAYVLGKKDKLKDEDQANEERERLVKEGEESAEELINQGKKEAKKLIEIGKFREAKRVKEQKNKEAYEIKENSSIAAGNIKANVSKPITLQKILDERKKLKEEKDGKIPKGIDTLTGAYTEQEFREILSENDRKHIYQFKMSDYGLNLIFGSSRAFHNMNTVLGYDLANEVIQIVFQEMKTYLEVQGFTLEKDKKGELFVARPPPENGLFASNKTFAPGDEMGQMLTRIKEQLDKRFTKELKDYIEKEISKKEMELEKLKEKKNITKTDLKQIAKLEKELANLNHVLKNGFTPSITLFHVSNDNIKTLNKSGISVSSRFQIINMMETIDSVYDKLSEENQSRFKEVFSLVESDSGNMKGVNFKPENWSELMKLYRAAQVIKANEAKLVLFPEKKGKSVTKKSKAKQTFGVAMTLAETRVTASELGLSPYSWTTEVLFAPLYEFFRTFNPFKFYKDHKYMGWRAGVGAMGIGLVWVSMIGFIVFVGYLMPDIKHIVYIAGTLSLISGVHLSRVQEIESKVFNLNRWNELSLMNKIALLFVLPMIIPNAGIHSFLNLLFRITRSILNFLFKISRFPSLVRTNLIEKNVELLVREIETKKRQGVSVPKNLIPEIMRNSLLNPIADYESLERFQISDNYQNLLQSLKLLQFAAILKNQREFNLPEFNITELSNLGDKEQSFLRTLRYMSETELFELLNSLDQLSRMDNKKMKESFGVWSEKLIESAAENSYYRTISSDQSKDQSRFSGTVPLTQEQGTPRMKLEQKELQITADQMVMAYQGFTAILSPKSKVSQEQKEMVKKVWENAIKSSKERLQSAKSNVKDINSLPVIQEIENLRITGAIDISNPNPQEDQIILMAQQIIQAWIGKAENIKGVVVPLITNQDSMNFEIIERVKKRLEDQGHLEIAQEFNKNIHFVVGTRGDLLSLIKERVKKDKTKPEIDPSIEMNPDDVNEVLLNKIQERVGETVKIKDLSLKLFTENANRYKKSWKSKIQIYRILPDLKVVEISKEIDNTLQARRVLALQQ